MSEFEHYSHELLASLVRDGAPEVLSDRGYVLTDAAELLGAIGSEIAERMRRVAWEGEAAEAFRTWGAHFARESGVLRDYADTIADAMITAGTALSEAQTTMPPPPDSVSSPTSRANPAAEMQAESERQEAIRVVERLTSFYRVSTDLMGTVREPRFEPPDLVPLDRHEGTAAADEAPVADGTTPPTPPGGENRQQGSAASAAAGTAGDGVAVPPTLSLTDVGDAGGPGGGGSVPSAFPGFEEQVGTSLDSAGESPPITASSGPGRGGGPPVPNAPPAPVGAGPWAPPPTGFVPGGLPPGDTGPASQRPSTGRPHPQGPPPAGRSPMPVGGTTPQQGPPPRAAAPGGQTPIAGRPPMVGGSPGQPTGRRPQAITGMPVGEGRGTVAGRSPAAGTPVSGRGGSGPSVRGQRRQQRNGIVGGVPLRAAEPESGGARIPQGGVVHPSLPPVEASEVGRSATDDGQPRSDLIGTRGQQAQRRANSGPRDDRYDGRHITGRGAAPSRQIADQATPDGPTGTVQQHGEGSTS